MKPTIIIGAGMAGYTVAREVRKLDKERPLLVITADDGGFYYKPMLSNAFAQGKQAAQLVSQSAAQMAAQLGAHILTGTAVSGVDTQRKTVQTQAGEFEYPQLVLAVGLAGATGQSGRFRRSRPPGASWRSDSTRRLIPCTPIPGKHSEERRGFSPSAGLPLL
jgi:NADPH-dependent 2,4-dienoyl-CoA reductase/sulfur reductase-like enzyme